MNADNAVTAALEKGSITDRHAKFLERLPAPDASLVLTRLLLPLKINANTTRDIVNMLDEISQRDSIRIETLLSAPPLADILATDAAKKKIRDEFVAALRRLRYPEFTKIEDAFNAIANRVRAEGGINVTAPKNFEGDRITFNLSAESAGELSDLLERLRTALDSGDIDKMFALLGSISRTG